MSRDNVYLHHILDAINLIETFVKGMQKADFMSNEMAIHATIRQLEIIGEATKNISKELRGKNPQIAWKQAAGTRDNLIHEYFNIDLDQVWNTIQSSLQMYKKQIVLLLESLI